MSLRAKATLFAAVTFCTVTIWAVHANQAAERETMYKGVIRDEARQARKRKEREEELEQSLAKRERYEAVQAVRPSPEAPPGV